MPTPARRQYLRIKDEHPDEILLFRMGDFYETFDDDARLISGELDIALTAREMGKGTPVPLAGVPSHALEGYLARLIKKGHRVAICEQTSDPATSKGIVDREVVRIVTPGTIIEDGILDQKTNNYLAAAIVVENHVGLAYVDITTSEFATTELPTSALLVELSRISPAEVLVANNSSIDLPEVPVTILDDHEFELTSARQCLLKHFGVTSLESFGCEELDLATQAAGAILEYLRRHQTNALSQLTSLHTYSTSSYMVLDPQTRHNLELFRGGRWGTSSTSLLATLDQTHTSMGARKLRHWIGQPLLSLESLNQRLDAVEWFVESPIRRGRVSEILRDISDIERLMNKVRTLTATPRDVVGLGLSLAAAPRLWKLLGQDEDSGKVAWLSKETPPTSDVVDVIANAITDDPPMSVSDGGVIQSGFSSDLDELRSSSKQAQAYIASLETRERDRTGIKSLKVGYNKVFGYYIEISRTNISAVPDEYIRRQTLVNAERYITPEMKEYESLVMNAQERIAELESALYRGICQQITEHAEAVMNTAIAIAQVDVFLSLAQVASQSGYVRPTLNDGDIIDIRQARHPVVEKTLSAGQFVANDVRLANSDEQLIILTGPNMSGKSTFIRQVAVITLMAQIGSFVPARSAELGIVDRIFTRVGLQDDLSTGQSTFMVEMLETAAILNHATPRSLVILDEIGRGTSTYDGLAIAQAIAEHIHNHVGLRCKTLFATHYHELTELADVLPRVKNYSVAVSEEKGKVVFLHHIVPGGADHSYGVYVARLAGMPQQVLGRAREVLDILENASASTSTPIQSSTLQLSMLNDDSPIIEELRSLDLGSMTPLEALTKLYELQQNASLPSH